MAREVHGNLFRLTWITKKAKTPFSRFHDFVLDTEKSKNALKYQKSKPKEALKCQKIQKRKWQISTALVHPPKTSTSIYPGVRASVSLILTQPKTPKEARKHRGPIRVRERKRKPVQVIEQRTVLLEQSLGLLRSIPVAEQFCALRGGGRRRGAGTGVPFKRTRNGTRRRHDERRMGRPWAIVTRWSPGRPRRIAQNCRCVSKSLPSRRWSPSPRRCSSAGAAISIGSPVACRSARSRSRSRRWSWRSRGCRWPGAEAAAAGGPSNGSEPRRSPMDNGRSRRTTATRLCTRPARDTAARSRVASEALRSTSPMVCAGKLRIELGISVDIFLKTLKRRIAVNISYVVYYRAEAREDD